MTDNVSKRLAKLGIELPKAPQPMATYVGYVVAGNLVFVSGQGTRDAEGIFRYIGKVGGDLTVEDGRKAARLCAINLLAQLRDACGGDLGRVRRVIKLGGFVNCTPDFTEHSRVVNGASQVMVDLFGDGGRHARFAVGASSLPSSMAVEVDGIFEIAK